MASLEGFISVLILTGLRIKADDGNCRFPGFMYEASGWDTGIRNEGRSSASFIIFEESKMISVDYVNWNNPEKETLCLRSFEGEKVLVSFPAEDTTLYKCIKFIKRSGHVIHLLESEPSESADVTHCEDTSMAINDWLLIWAGTANEYQDCGLTGGFSIMDIYVPARNQHLCENLSLPPRIESECQYGEGILINFRYPQCVTDINMPIYEMKISCLGSWSAYGFTYKVITDGASFLPRLWLMRFPVNDSDDFHMDFIKDIVADRADTVAQTNEYLRWRLERKVFPSLCEDESSDCSSCLEDVGFYCQKSCQKCDPVQVQQRCTFDQLLKGEWLESSWSGSRTIRVTNSLLYPSRLSPFECFVIGGQDSLDWLEITGRQTLVSVRKNGCSPRYSCMAINSINPTVAQYRLSQGIVWPHSQNLQAEDICDYNQFQDDNQPLGNTYRSQYEKYLVKNPNGRNRQPSACNLNGNFVFTAVFNDQDDACVGTLKQCTDDSTTLVLHVPSCRKRKPLQTLNCLSSTIEVRERFIIVEDSEKPSDIFCIVSSTETNDNRMFLLHASDCHVNILIMMQYGQFSHHIVQFQSAEEYNSTTECLTSDIVTPDETEIPETTDTVSVTDANIDITTTEADIDVNTEVTTAADDHSAMPMFTKGYDVTITEKRFEPTSTNSVIPSDFTTLSTSISTSKSSTSKINVQREVSTPREDEVKSDSSCISCAFLSYILLICVLCAIV